MDQAAAVLAGSGQVLHQLPADREVLVAEAVAGTAKIKLQAAAEIQEVIHLQKVVLPAVAAVDHLVATEAAVAAAEELRLQELKPLTHIKVELAVLEQDQLL